MTITNIKCYKKDCKHWSNSKKDCGKVAVTLFIEDTVGCADYDSRKG